MVAAGLLRSSLLCRPDVDTESHDVQGDTAHVRPDTRPLRRAAAATHYAAATNVTAGESGRYDML